MKPNNCLSTTSGVVLYGTTPLLDPLPDTLQASVAPGGHGVFLDLQLPRKKEALDIPLGTIPGLKRFVAWRRFEPYWMAPVFGSAVGEIPKETQGLLYQRADGLHVLLVPLFGPRFRFALESRDDILQLVADTGDAFAPDDSGLAAFIAAGSDPFELLARSAEAVRARLPGARLRREKAVPDFIEDFGWCTWDAFYVSVNPDKVKQGLAALRDAGVPPKTLILDDGWQSVREDDDDLRLTAFAANKKFGGSLKPLVEDAKRDFGIKRFLVWHAFNGYWNGVAPEAFQAFGAHEVPRQFSRDILATHPNYNHQMWWGSGFIWAHAVGLIPPEKIAQFFDAFHTLLAAEGVDGVKVDVQSGLEALSQGQGGRVALFRAYREGLESSVRKHFAGRLINCMCHASENLYLCADSLVTRGSQDFWPGDHRSYAMHLLTNAQFGLWFGEWVQPDWDMFHSKHPYGAYNAAGRALSGGPIYVSDKPGEHDATLLKKLVCTDGSILRPDLPGRPTPDTLYRDPSKDGKPLKIFNRVGSAAVVGVFHPVCAPLEGQDEAPPVSGHLRLEDIPGFAASDCAIFAHSTGRLARLKRGDSLPYALQRGGWEIFSLVPVERAVAAIGLADKFISPATIRDQIWRDPLTLQLTLRDAGELVLFCEKKPSAVLADAAPIPNCFRENLLRFKAPPSAPIRVRW